MKNLKVIQFLLVALMIVATGVVSSTKSAQAAKCISGWKVKDCKTVTGNWNKGNNDTYITTVPNNFLMLKNDCHYPVAVVLAYQDYRQNWQTAGWYHFNAYAQGSLNDYNGKQIVAGSSNVYLYAKATNGVNYFWRGNTDVSFGGSTYPMVKARVDRTDNGDWQVYMYC